MDVVAGVSTATAAAAAGGAVKMLPWPPPLSVERVIYF
jgi:hypothetical protein